MRSGLPNITRETATVGAIAKRPVLTDGIIQEREHLCLTVSFDHDVVDGAPATRFTSQLVRRLSKGDILHNVSTNAGNT